VVLIGDEELAAGEATVRDLSDGTQRRVPFAHLALELGATP